MWQDLSKYGKLPIIIEISRLTQSCHAQMVGSYMIKLSSTLALLTALCFSTAALNGCAATNTSKTTASNAMKTSNASVEQITPMPSKALPKTLTRIAFGSCLSEKEDQSIWTTLAAENPDAFIFMGDNVYGDAYRSNPLFSDPTMPKMRSAYNELASSAPFANFRAQVPVMPIWDDHDYGANDGGADYLFKDQAKELFLDAWAVPQNDVRRKREGVYTSQIIGDAGKQVQIILLDTRSFRTYLQATDKRNEPGKERYVPLESGAGTMLGDAQWDWLQAELKKPADLRLLVSTIQVIADGHGWEAWRTMPAEREKLYTLLKDTGANDVVLLSGDRHAGAFYKREDVLPYTLNEFTSSSLNLPASKWRAQSGETRIEEGPYRTTTMQFEVNYGIMDIDWSARQAKVRLVSPGNDTFLETVDF